MFPDEDMSSRIKARLADGTLPPDLDHPSKWPAGMRDEWGNDEGANFARRHREQYFQCLDRVRDSLDRFHPDAVIMNASAKISFHPIAYSWPINSC